MQSIQISYKPANNLSNTNNHPQTYKKIKQIYFQQTKAQIVDKLSLYKDS